MKRFLLLAVAVIMTCAVNAASRVSVTLSDGIDNASVKTKIENTISALLTEANAAHEAGREMNYSAIGIPTSVQGAISALWENSPFVSMDDEIVEHCLTTGTGYQVRNLPLLLKPLNASDVAEDEEYQEGVASFDKQGNLVSFYLSISMNLYMNVIRENSEVFDLRRRQLILDWVEQFRTSYNQKDINFLEAVFSEDALIITGRVTQRKTGDGIPMPDQVVYTPQGKREYLTNLRRVFAANRSIHVTFDEIEVMSHPVNQNFYGVTLHQGYSSDRYRDEGYLFLLWDFRDEQHPQIRVRTWQPDAYNVNGTGLQRIPKDKIFSLADFDIE